MPPRCCKPLKPIPYSRITYRAPINPCWSTVCTEYLVCETTTKLHRVTIVSGLLRHREADLLLSIPSNPVQILILFVTFCWTCTQKPRLSGLWFIRNSKMFVLTYYIFQCTINNRIWKRPQYGNAITRKVMRVLRNGVSRVFFARDFWFMRNFASLELLVSRRNWINDVSLYVVC